MSTTTTTTIDENDYKMEELILTHELDDDTFTFMHRETNRRGRRRGGYTMHSKKFTTSRHVYNSLRDLVLKSFFNNNSDPDCCITAITTTVYGGDGGPDISFRLDNTNNYMKWGWTTPAGRREYIVVGGDRLEQFYHDLFVF